MLYFWDYLNFTLNINDLIKIDILNCRLFSLYKNNNYCSLTPFCQKKSELMQVQTINYFLGRPNLNVFKRFNQLNSFTQVGMFKCH